MFIISFQDNRCSQKLLLNGDHCFNYDLVRLSSEICQNFHQQNYNDYRTCMGRKMCRNSVKEHHIVIISGRLNQNSVVWTRYGTPCRITVRYTPWSWLITSTWTRPVRWRRTVLYSVGYSTNLNMNHSSGWYSTPISSYCVREMPIPTRYSEICVQGHLCIQPGTVKYVFRATSLYSHKK